MDTIIIAIISVTAIGVICAAALCMASKIMAVKTDERVEQVLKILPGSNCGACGYPGCSGYAEAIIVKKAKNSLCTPGGEQVLKQLSALLGVKAGEYIRKNAVVHCIGGRSTGQKKMEYKGIRSCAGAKQLFGGENACAFGCLGYGDCQACCPENAICMENGLARINTGLCTGCGLCVKSCPNNLISLMNSSISVIVLCKNIEKGAHVRKKCRHGCIGCGKCMRECPDGAIVIEDNLARINYDKCSLCAHCAEVCITGCIYRQFKQGLAL